MASLRGFGTYIITGYSFPIRNFPFPIFPIRISSPHDLRGEEMASMKDSISPETQTPGPVIFGAGSRHIRAAANDAGFYPGRVTMKVALSPGTLSAWILPRWASTMVLAMARPRPLPAISWLWETSSR